MILNDVKDTCRVQSRESRVYHIALLVFQQISFVESRVDRIPSERIGLKHRLPLPTIDNIMSLQTAQSNRQMGGGHFDFAVG